MKHTHRYVLALILGAAAGCKDDDPNGGPATPTEIQTVCQDYCDRSKLCDDEVNVSDCVVKCKDRLGACMADEQGQAVDELRVCSDESCDDFTGCTIGAGIQCILGI